MPIHRTLKMFGAVALAMMLLCAAAWADTVVQEGSAGAQAATDSINWQQLGGDQSLQTASFNVVSGQGLHTAVGLAGANSVASVVCSGSPANCSWTGGLAGASPFTAGDTLLWTSDAAAGGNGPVTLTFAAGVAGAGALIQANAPGAFTAQIQVFNGATLLGTFTASSDGNGDPVYIGAMDTTGPNITQVVFSVTNCGATDTSGCNDFGVDKVGLNDQAAGITLGALVPNSVTAAQGNPTPPMGFQVGATGPFSGQVALSCSGLPGNASCAFLPSASVSPTAAAPVNVTLTVQTGTTAAGGPTTVTVSAASAGVPSPSPQTFALTITKGSGSADLAASIATVNGTPNPVLVGAKASVVLKATNLTSATSIPAGTMVATFAPAGRVKLGAMPANCAVNGGNQVTCNFAASASVGTASFTIPFQTGFVRSVSVSMTVSSGATDPNPANNTANLTVNVRPRPWTRKGVPPKLP